MQETTQAPTPRVRSLKLPGELWKRLRVQAAAEDMGVAEFVRVHLSRLVAERETATRSE